MSTAPLQIRAVLNGPKEPLPQETQLKHLLKWEQFPTWMVELARTYAKK